MLVVGLLGSHHHFLADEKWNCPADEFFRRTNLADARVIHYFGDGHYVQGMRLGRNPATWAGKKWYACHARAARQLNLSRWEALDPDFKGRIGRFLAESPVSWRRHVFRFARRQGERFRNMMRA